MTKDQTLYSNFFTQAESILDLKTKLFPILYISVLLLTSLFFCTFFKYLDIVLVRFLNLTNRFGRCSTCLAFLENIVTHKYLFDVYIAVLMMDQYVGPDPKS